MNPLSSLPLPCRGGRRTGPGWRAALLALMMLTSAYSPTGEALAQSRPAGTGAAAASPPAPDHRQETIAHHRALADAHAQAARCLEAGTAEEQCHARLREACRGLALGKLCGMKHSH